MTRSFTTSVSVFENFPSIPFLLPGLKYDSFGMLSSICKVDGFVSSKLDTCLGLRVLPKNFSPDGDRGGVYLGECFV